MSWNNREAKMNRKKIKLEIHCIGNGTTNMWRGNRESRQVDRHEH
jgi:hypothetical protein